MSRKQYVATGVVILAVVALGYSAGLAAAHVGVRNTLLQPSGEEFAGALTSPGAVRTIDLAGLRVHETEESADLGPRPDRPWVGPGPWRSQGMSPLVRWRSRQLVVPPNHQVDGVLGHSVVTSTYPAVLEARDFDGSVRLLGRYGDSFLTSRVFGLRGRALAYVVEKTGRDDRIFLASAADDGVVRLDPQDFGPRPEGTQGLHLDVQAILGKDDIVYLASWLDKRWNWDRIGYARTSGTPVNWQLERIGTFSASAQLVAGWSTLTKKQNCIAVYQATASVPEWTTCFTRSDAPARVLNLTFSPDASHLVGSVQGRHGDADTLLVLDADSGRIDHQWERDLGHYPVVFEDDRHLLFTNQTMPEDGPDGESPFKHWLVRCSLTGHCEKATPPRTTSNFEWPLRVLPRSD
jgi:hypothetical protein